MLDTDPRAWSLWVTWLYAFTAYCTVGFVLFWFRFRALERDIESGVEGALARFDGALEGFPNAVYAKMFGKRPLGHDDVGDAPSARDRKGPGRQA